jgi:uncharacterized protein with GYD domain
MMALYVQLVKLSRAGVMKLPELAGDFAKVQAFNESLGGKFLYVVACFGEYDFVALADYPDEVAALKGAAYAAAQGNATIQTLPARPIEEFFKLVSELPK